MADYLTIDSLIAKLQLIRQQYGNIEICAMTRADDDTGSERANNIEVTEATLDNGGRSVIFVP